MLSLKTLEISRVLFSTWQGLENLVLLQLLLLIERQVLSRLRWVKSLVLQLLGRVSLGNHELFVLKQLSVEVRVDPNSSCLYSRVFIKCRGLLLLLLLLLNNLVLESLFLIWEHYVLESRSLRSRGRVLTELGQRVLVTLLITLNTLTGEMSHHVLVCLALTAFVSA